MVTLPEFYAISTNSAPQWECISTKQRWCVWRPTSRAILRTMLAKQFKWQSPWTDKTSTILDRMPTLLSSALDLTAPCSSFSSWFSYSPYWSLHVLPSCCLSCHSHPKSPRSQTLYQSVEAATPCRGVMPMATHCPAQDKASDQKLRFINFSAFSTYY